MTMHRFAIVLLAMCMTGSASLWIYAFTLCERRGKILLTAGLFLAFEPHVGRHEMPVYEDEPVHIRERRTEEQRIAAYATMVAETAALPVTTSAAPYTAWATALHPTDLDDLRARLDQVQRDFMTGFAMRVDAVVEEFLRERTDELAIVR